MKLEVVFNDPHLASDEDIPKVPPDLIHPHRPLEHLASTLPNMASESCHRPICTWLHADNISAALGGHVPHLDPEPEISGIGVIAGFSATAFITLALLILHYVAVYDPLRTNSRGETFAHPVDKRFLALIRGSLIWKPSRRFEYALERSVLLLSDTQLVTGLAILVAGYSQLNCGITAYHWQIMVYVAWFASFTFLSAMAFLQSYFKLNSGLRILRAFCMFILASLLIVALLPTGSANWLDLVNEGGGFYPSLSAQCYFRQLGMKSYGFDKEGRLKIWSMVLSIFVVGISYIHGAIRLFDPTSEFTRKYIRGIPGSYIKTLLYFFERRAMRKGRRAMLWKFPYLVWYAAFAIARAVCDIFGSMLGEIIWLTFALAWGTIKLITTRQSIVYNSEGEDVNANPEVLKENSWSFGQTLPLVLLLLPLLSMAQVYLDNEAKEHEARFTADASDTGSTRPTSFTQASDLNSIHVAQTSISKRSNTGSWSRTRSTRECSHADSATIPLHRCLHHTSSPPSPTLSPTTHDSSLPISTTSNPTTNLPSHTIIPHIPSHPYTLSSFHSTPWYTDLLTLLIFEILMVAGFILFLLNSLGSSLGVSYFLRSRLFLIWVFGVIPLAALGFLGSWFVLGVLWELVRGRAGGCGRVGGQLDGRVEEDGGSRGEEGEENGKPMTLVKKMLFWLGRAVLVCGWTVFTFFVSVEIAGPNGLSID